MASGTYSRFFPNPFGNPTTQDPCRVCNPFGTGGASAGVFVNPKWQSVMELERWLELSPEESAQFHSLNPHLNFPYKMLYPGELVLLGDPQAGCSHQVEEQMEQVWRVHKTLNDLRAPTDDFLLDNYALINRLLGYESLGLALPREGTLEVRWENGRVKQFIKVFLINKDDYGVCLGTVFISGIFIFFCSLDVCL